MTFGERSESMGLRALSDNDNMWAYEDEYSYVEYERLIGEHTRESAPVLAIRTRGPHSTTEEGNEIEPKYVGYVSDNYVFMGNEGLVSRVRDSIREVGSPILETVCLMDENYAKLECDIIISHSENVQQVGDVFPKIVIRNSYNGEWAASFRFGLHFQGENEVRYGFSFKKSFGYLISPNILFPTKRVKNLAIAFMILFFQIKSNIAENALPYFPWMKYSAVLLSISTPFLLNRYAAEIITNLRTVSG